MDVKRRKSNEEGEADRISNLPVDLVCRILSFLSTKEAALTSVVSKTWRDLFTRIPSLDLDDSIFVLGERSEECKRSSFMEFVNRVLALQSNSPITKFSLRCHKGVNKDLVDDWVLQALKRGASDLTLVLLIPPREYSLPCSIFFYGQNLIKLKLGCGQLGISRSITQGDIIFTKLKTLHLDSIEFGRDGTIFSLLLSKCPVLEELIINCMKWHRWRSDDASVSSSTLKSLTIDCEHYFVKLPSSKHFAEDFKFATASPHNVSFDTPNLLYLNYSDFVACNYPIVKLDSLVEARLDVGSTISQMHVRDSNNQFEVRWDATNLIIGIQNVQTLHLTSDTLEVIADFCHTVPVFNNLNHLSIEGDKERGWQALPLLLINCPNIQTLVFHGLHHSVTDGCGDICDCISPSSFSCLSSCHVKILKILEFGATCGEMSLVEHFLKKLSRLEQVIIVTNFDSALEDDLDIFKVSRALEMAPKASPNCKLKVVNY